MLTSVDVHVFQSCVYATDRQALCSHSSVFHAFLSRLAPQLQEHVGGHVQGDLEAAMAMAQRLEVYRGGDGAKAGGEKKGSGGKFKKTKQKGDCRNGAGQ